MDEWVRTGGTVSDEELADRWSQVELESRPAEDVEWDEEIAGEREYETIATLDGEEVARMRYRAHYSSASTPGSGTSDEAKAEAAEFVASRVAATGNGVSVAHFSESDKATVNDVEMRDGHLELVPVGTIPITPSPPPKLLRRLTGRGAPSRTPSRTTPRVVATPRERRARTASASRASPSGSEADLEPPGDSAGIRRMPGVAGLLSVFVHALRLPRAFTRPRRRGRAARPQRRSGR
jgi:hypothetical protein